MLFERFQVRRTTGYQPRNSKSWKAAQNLMMDNEMPVLRLVTLLFIIGSLFIIKQLLITEEQNYYFTQDINVNQKLPHDISRVDVDAMKSNIEDHVIEKHYVPVLTRKKRATRDYSVTACEKVLGGVCRRNDNACGGTYVGGSSCSLGTKTTVTRAPFYHECCVAAQFTPTNRDGDPMVGTPQEMAVATIDYLVTDGFQIPDSNCEDPTAPVCTFWTGGLKADTVSGLIMTLNESGCDKSEVEITAAAEPTHTHADFGTGITAQNGNVLTVEGSVCLDEFIRANYLSVGQDRYEDDDGNQFVRLSSTNNGRYDIAYSTTL